MKSPFSIGQLSHLCVLGLAVACLVVPAAAQTWNPEGPAPLDPTQSVGGVPLGNDYGSGAIQALGPHPSDSDVLYIGAANGGIWRTDDATSAAPTWVAQTLDKPSGAISVLDLDPMDATGQTVIAGHGNTSSYSSAGLGSFGVLYTANGGTTWTYVNGPGDLLSGRFISGVEARGTVLLATVSGSSCGSIGAFRSLDTGATWTQLSLAGGYGLPIGSNEVMEGDPNNTAVLYTGVNALGASCEAGSNGIYKSTDTGATWTKISDATMDALINTANASGTDIKISVSKANSSYIFVSIMPNPPGDFDASSGIYHTTDGGATWTAMDGPASMPSGGLGTYPKHYGLQADATDPNVCYIGGTGERLRGDAVAAAGSQWQINVGSNTANSSAPHADLRDYAFRADGVLLEADDGGVFGRTLPAADWKTGDWFSLSGDLHVAEGYHVAYDPLSDRIFIGTQDNASVEQLNAGDPLWSRMHSGDGGDVSVDIANYDTYDPGGGPIPVSSRYRASQNFGGFRRERRDASNNDLGAVIPALTVVSGNPAPTWGWLNPHEVNRVNGERMIVGHYGTPNGVYESLDRCETLTEIISGVGIRNDAIAYGATGNPDVLYLGLTGGVFARTAAHPAAATQVLSLPGVMDVEVDPDDPTHAFAVDSTRVYRTQNSGGAWTEITGDLGSLSPNSIRTIVYFPDPPNDALLVGTYKGVFWAREAGGFNDWSVAGTGLPVTMVYDMDKGITARKVIASTLGHSTWSLTVPVEDNWPPVAEGATFRIVPGTPNTTSVGTVQANDPENHNLEYAITAGNTGSAFAINLNTGEITVADNSGFGSDPTYTLTVTVTDDGSPVETDTATITIIITDCPDPTVVLNLLDSGECSLRDRVVDAPGGSTITFDAGLNGDIPLQSEILITSKTLTIDGEDRITVKRNSGTSYTRHFRYTGTANVTLRRLTLADGNCVGQNCGGSGSERWRGGSVYAQNSTVTAIFDRVTFRNNNASYGGALNIRYADVQVKDCTFDGNTAIQGAGISDVNNNTASSKLVVSGSTFTGNSSATGAGIFHLGGGAIIFNSTFSGNTGAAIRGNGGGTWSLALSNLTIAGNTTGIDRAQASATVTVTNSILANNTNNCAGTATITDRGNLSDDATCAPIADGTGVDPLLAALADNGGPTETRALQVGSPAIDAASANLDECANAATVNGLDQRGGPRDATCDLGAYEYGAALCSATMSLVNATWTQISMPCVPVSATVADVFGDDGLGTFGSDWAMHRWDEVADDYQALAIGDTMAQGDGYWIKAISGTHQLDIEGAYASDPFDVSVTGDAGGTFNMIGNPFNLEVAWNEVTVDVGGGTFKSVADLNATEATTILSSSKWEYSGSGYDVCDPRGVCLAPDDPTMSAYDGFWVKAFTNTTLRIPAVGARHSSRLAPGEWYVRLTAEAAGGLVDQSNLLGRLTAAEDGQDSLDVEELPPFDSTYLTLVFPHPTWGGDAWAWTTDYRQARLGAGGSWSVKAYSNLAREITLTWLTDGDPLLLERSWLQDETNGVVVPARDGFYTVTMDGTSHDFTWVVDAVPQVEAGTDRTVNVGQELALVVPFTDEDDGDSHTATIDWGDGAVDIATVDSVAATAGGAHTFVAEGSFTVTVCVVDQLGLGSCDSFLATVEAATGLIFSDDFETGDTSGW